MGNTNDQPISQVHTTPQYSNTIPQKFKNVTNRSSYLNALDSCQGRSTNDEQKGDEKKLIKGLDRRDRADPKDYKPDNLALQGIGKLRMQFGDTFYVGSAIIINIVPKYDHFTRDPPTNYSTGYVYALTAAHNVVDVDPIDETKAFATNVWFERRVNTMSASTIKHTYNVVNKWVHPKYFQQPTSSSGYDIAVLKIRDDDRYLSKIPTIRLYVATTEYQQYASVIGFPGEYHGALGGMGNRVKYIDNKGVITYDSIDTTGGQSGSPIFMHGSYFDDNGTFDVGCLNSCEGFEGLIGIHTGGNTRNWGTAFNKEKIQWICKITGYSVANLCDGGACACVSSCLWNK